MKIIGITDEDFVNYKKPAMFIAFPYCTFKCDRECGKLVCQNSELANSPKIEVDPNSIVDRYMDNPITKAIVCGGLEPLDTWDELLGIIKLFRERTTDDIVIYTGYKEDEIQDKLELLKQYENIIVKVGRFIPDQKERFDEVLGIHLASDNQYAINIRK